MKRIDSIVRKALSRYPGISNCSESVDGYEHCFAFDGGPEMLEDQCLFDNVGDEDKRILLLHLFSAKGVKANWGWKVNVELAKLAAKCGRLVRDEAERCLYDGFERTYWTDNVLRVAYFGSDLCYEDRLVDLIEVRADDCGDGYDGLFIACWFMNSPRTDAALAERFADWFKNGTLDRGGCSMADVFRLICKWEREERGAACGGRRRLYHDYVQRRCDVAHFRANGLW